MPISSPDTIEFNKASFFDLDEDDNDDVLPFSLDVESGLVNKHEGIKRNDKDGKFISHIK